MKLAAISLFVSFQIFFICNPQNVFACSEKDFRQIKVRFDESYKKYDFFWSTLHCYEKSAMRGDVEAISSIMDLSNVGQQNAEFTEWHYELEANLFVKFPAKFFDVLLTKDKKTIDYGMDRLKMPLIVETEAISGAAKKIIKKPKYKKLAKQLIAK